jgi:predicted secreted protein
MKTAVEWLVNNLKQNHGIDLTLYSEFEQAKEMEKQQIKSSFNEGYTQCSIEDLKHTSRKRYEDAEQYYNEPFKSE